MAYDIGLQIYEQGHTEKGAYNEHPCKPPCSEKWGS